VSCQNPTPAPAMRVHAPARLSSGCSNSTRAISLLQLMFLVPTTWFLCVFLGRERVYETPRLHGTVPWRALWSNRCVCRREGVSSFKPDSTLPQHLLCSADSCVHREDDVRRLLRGALRTFFFFHSTQKHHFTIDSQVTLARAAQEATPPRPASRSAGLYKPPCMKMVPRADARHPFACRFQLLY
jgi:hypothetical protein